MRCPRSKGRGVFYTKHSLPRGMLYQGRVNIGIHTLSVQVMNSVKHTVYAGGRSHLFLLILSFILFLQL